MGANYGKGLNQYAAQLISRKARELAKQYGFSKSDTQDLEHEFWLDLLPRLSSYDPCRSEMNTFINRLVANKIVNIKEHQEAGKRDYRLRAGSLDEDVEDEEGESTSPADVIDEEDCFRRLGWSCGPSEEERDLKIDLAAVVDSLPTDLREVWERLKIQDVTEMSIAMRISRSSVYRKIEEIRKILRAKGLEEYL